MELVTTRRRHPQGGVSALLVLLLAFVVGSFAHAAPRSKAVQFDIPAGDGSVTLAEFVLQAQLFAAFRPEFVQGVQTNAVSGVMEGRDALKRMLAGTNLRIWEGDGWLTILPVDSPVPASMKPLDMEVKGAVATVPTDSDRAKPGAAVYAQTSDGQELEEVVITGTLIHGALDVISPLEKITRRQMNQSAYASAQDVMRSITMNFGGGPGESAGTVGNFARGSSVNLRGLGAGATLVLINGRRMPYSGTESDFVDVSIIPRSALDRIEVLPDGASALYGSDAIAGVVNFILEKDFDGGETTARVGASPAGANEKLFSQTSGTTWASGNALLSYQYSERTALPTADREYTRDTDKRSLGGTDHRSYRSSPGNILDPATFLPVFGIQPNADGGATLSDTINLQNQFAPYDVLGSRRSHGLFATISQNIGERFEIFADALFGKRFTAQQLPAVELPLFVPGSNPFLGDLLPQSPFAVVGYNFLNDLGPTGSRTTTQTYSVTLGANLKFDNDWHATFFESHGREQLRFSVANQVDPAALGIALADPNPGTAFNPFGDGSSNNPATLENIRTEQRGSISSEIRTTSVVADGPITHLPSGAIKLAIGAERRDELLDRELFEKASFGRTVNSVFAELSVPIIGDADDAFAIPRLELSLADRFESYSDFGTTTNPKVGLRWAPLRSLKFRTSWGTSFRAPKLLDLYNSGQNAAALSVVPDPGSATGSSVILLVSQNNPNLKQETASTWTAGVDFAPAFVPGFKASVTYFSIDYDNQVRSPLLAEQTNILIQASRWASRIKHDPSAEDINAICSSSIFHGTPGQCSLASIAAIVDYGPQNVARTREHGFDLKLDQSLDTRYGNLTWGLNGTYMFSFEQAESKTSPLLSVMNTVGNPLGLRVRSTIEWYQHAWDTPGFGVSLALDHWGGYRDVQARPIRGVDAWTTADLRLSYRTARNSGSLEGIEVGLNASNLFDRSPPFIDSELGFDTSNAQPYGRVLSLTLQKRW